MAFWLLLLLLHMPAIIEDAQDPLDGWLAQPSGGYSRRQTNAALGWTSETSN